MVFEETVVVGGDFAGVVTRVKEALAAEGFGVLSEIDVQATLRSKVGKELDQFLILGACNPHLAARAIDIDPQIGVLLPCNVVVRQAGGDVVVEALDPGIMSTLVGSAEIEPVAAEARRRISDALDRLID